MKMTMLEYSKLILKKVSFDPQLFQKELNKAYSYLGGKELEELSDWVLAHFDKLVTPELIRVKKSQLK